MDFLQDVDIDMQDAFSLTKGRPYPTEEFWNLMRPTITRLYQDEKKSLKHVMKIMERDHFLYASERMFKTRIKNWGLDKKFKEAEVVAMLQLKRERDAVGKKSRFVIRNQNVDWDRVAHYLKRRPDLLRQLGAANLQLSEVCLDIVCRTPSPVNAPNVPCLLEPAPELRFPEEILRILRSYLDGAFEGGMWTTKSKWLYGRGQKASRHRIYDFNKNMGVANTLLLQNQTKAAFYLVNKQLESLRTMIIDQDPELLYGLCFCIYSETINDVGLWEPLTSFVHKMHQVVLGERHPLSLIWSKLESTATATATEALFKIVSTIFMYSAQYLERRVSLQNDTAIWIHTRQLVLLPHFMEHSDYKNVLSAYARQAAVALQNDDHVQAAAWLLRVANGQRKKYELDTAMSTLEEGQHLLLKCDPSSTRWKDLQYQYYESMGRCMAWSGQRAESVGYYVKAYEHQVEHSGPDSHGAFIMAQVLANVYHELGDIEKVNQWRDVFLADLPETFDRMNLGIEPGL